MSRYKYRENDAEVAKKHAANKGDYDRVIKDKFKIFTAKVGKNRIRILGRTWEGDPKHWAFPLFQHYGVGPDDARYPCPKRMKWGDCPICDEAAELVAEGDKEAADKLRASKTQLVWVIDRNNENEGPQVCMMSPKQLEGPLCDLSQDQDTGALLKIDHAEKGHDIIFTRTGTGRTGTSYSAAAVLPKKTPLSDDPKEMDEWLELVEKNPLPTVINQYDYDYLKKVFSGKSAKRKADDDDEEPAPRSRRERSAVEEDEEPTPRSKARAEPDDDEPPPRSRRVREIDDEKADLDEPEAKAEEPARTRRRSTIDDDKGEDEDRGNSRGRSDSTRGSRGDDEQPRQRTNLREEVKAGLKSRRRDED